MRKYKYCFVCKEELFNDKAHNCNLNNCPSAWVVLLFEMKKLKLSDEKIKEIKESFGEKGIEW